MKRFSATDRLVHRFSSWNIHSISIQRGKLNIEPVELATKARSFVEAHKGIYMVKSQRLLYPLTKQVAVFTVLIELLEHLLEGKQENHDL